MTAARHRSLDLGEVVLVAAAVSGDRPDDIVSVADLGVLVGATGRARDARTIPEAAAELLVAVAAGRPFRHDDRAIAWCLAAQLVAVNSRQLDLDVTAAIALVADAAAGRVDERGVAVVLARAIGRRQGRVRRAAARLGASATAAPAIADWACPVCQRPVAVAPGRSSVFLAGPRARDLVVDCSTQNAGHDREGIWPDHVRTGRGRDEHAHRLDVLRARLVIAAAEPQRV